MRAAMEYNRGVKRTMPRSDAVRLIRFAAILWIGYVVVLALINQAFPAPLPPQQPPPPQQGNLLYYVLLGDIAFLCLALTYWSWIQRQLRQAFVPVVVAIITVVPVIVNHWTGRLSPLGPRFSTPEGSVLAIFPFLFVGLLLVAWQYKWQYILLIILGIAGLNLGVIWSSAESGTPPFQGGLVITLIQTVIFLAVGFSISYLMSRLRGQQQSLEAANIRLTHYASTLEHLATSRERNRLARELHDTLAHTLSGLSVQLEAVKAYWDVDRQTARSVLEKSLAGAHTGLEETRRALQALRASPLDDLGLALAIKAMAQDAAARGNLALSLSIIDKMPPLSPDVEQAVYRVAQEAVTNVVNHARAKNLTIRLEFTEGKVSLIVRDDGTGFDTEKNHKSRQFGLTGMRERAELVGGQLSVESKPDMGTMVQFTV
jgi:signal transduction histidine kinase